MGKGNGIKVIVSMIGLDGHTTGGEVVSMILRDAGFEVVYMGVNQTPEMIVKAAIQEDANVIGISSHASNYAQIEEVMSLLRQNALDEVVVVCGGNIPRRQIDKLLACGVAKVFPPGSGGSEIIDYLATQVSARRAPRQSDRKAGVTTPA